MQDIILPFLKWLAIVKKKEEEQLEDIRSRVQDSTDKHKIVSIIPCLQSHSYVKCPLWKLFYCPSCQMVLLHGNLQCSVQ